MIFRQTLKALLSHWRQHPVQFFSVLTGLWLATSLLTGVQALNSQARDSYARASQLIGGEPQASLNAPGGGTFPQQWFIDLRRQGWPVSPVLQARVLLERHEDQRLQTDGHRPGVAATRRGPGGAGAGHERGGRVFLPTPVALGSPRKPCRPWGWARATGLVPSMGNRCRRCMSKWTWLGVL